MAAKGSEAKGKVGIVGSGFIGRGWAMLFAGAGYDVCMYDLLPQQTADAVIDIKAQLHDLHSNGLLRGERTPEQQLAHISTTTDLAQMAENTIHIQECVFERMELKKDVFAKLDQVVGDKTVLCSSTSSMPCSTFTSELKHRNQCIVGHPVNPPYYCPLVEVVPAPYTDEWVTTQTMEIMHNIGQEPVKLNREIDGFALNRVQYACLNECWSLVENGAISIEDIDKVMKHGLGLRFAFMGPMETIHLNANGMKDYCDRYGEMIYRISKDLYPVPKLVGEAAQKMEDKMVKSVPLEKVPERMTWRNKCLASLAKLKKSLGN